MARPRQITDERMLTAAALVIGRLGPGFALADVAAEARVAVGTVAQRFGSKHGLLVAMTTHAIAGMRDGMQGAGDDPVEALIAAYAPLDDAATAANNLAQLSVDLADPELRALMADFYAAMEAEIARLIARSDLEPPANAARILTAVADGTALHWSARPVGGLTERLRADLSAVTAGWRRKDGST